MDRRNVKRPRQRLGGGDRPVELQVEVLGREAVKIYRSVPDKCPRKDYASLEGRKGFRILPVLRGAVAMSTSDPLRFRRGEALPT